MRLAPKERPICDNPVAALLRKRPDLSVYRIGKDADIGDANLCYIAKGQMLPRLITALKLEKTWGIPVSAWALTDLGQREWRRIDRDTGKERLSSRARQARWDAKNREKNRLRMKAHRERMKANATKK